MPDAARSIYLDHAATTPVAPAVLAAMLPYFTEFYGNPSSLHGPGRRASVALQQARRTIAEWLGARPGEIILTSGGTESGRRRPPRDRPGAAGTDGRRQDHHHARGAQGRAQRRRDAARYATAFA